MGARSIRSPKVQPRIEGERGLGMPSPQTCVVVGLDVLLFSKVLALFPNNVWLLRDGADIAT
jgi:hypothetical protein